MVQLPEQYLMAGRLSLLLRGVGNAFGLKIRMSTLWESEADSFLLDQQRRFEPQDYDSSRPQRMDSSEASASVTAKVCPVSGKLCEDGAATILKCPFHINNIGWK